MRAERRAALALEGAVTSRRAAAADLERAAGLIAEALEGVVPRGMGVEVGRVGLEGEFVVCLLQDDEPVYHGAVYVDSDEDGGLLVDGRDLAAWVRAVTS